MRDQDKKSNDVTNLMRYKSTVGLLRDIVIEPDQTDDDFEFIFINGDGEFIGHASDVFMSKAVLVLLSRVLANISESTDDQTSKYRH
jgi:hypothetical protein